MTRNNSITSILVVGVMTCSSYFSLVAAQSTKPVSVEPRPSDVETIDLSEWVKEYSKLGITSYRRKEFYMRSKLSGYYYVLVAPDDYSSDGATVSVTLRNVNRRRSRLGYGLIFHSDPTPLKQDYAFLIDTVKRRFRVVRHAANDEKRWIPWTNSSFIKYGRLRNTLVATDKGEETELYINGHYVATIKNTFAFNGGTPGLYTDTINIAFSKFTLSRVPIAPSLKQ